LLARAIQAFGGNRNPAESGGIRRNPEESRVNTGIPVPEESLRKNPVTAAKRRNSCDHLQNHVPVKNSSGKHREKKKSSGILAGTVFLVQKINS
jgi:hypothetical protein